MSNKFCAIPPEPRRTWTKEEKVTLLGMKLSGWSLCQLATRYDVPPYEIREALEDIVREISLDPLRCKDVSFRIKPIRRYTKNKLGRFLGAIF